MEQSLNFDYFYGTEAESYFFYRVPKLLITDKHFNELSSDAKILYGLLLDRMSLSIKNGWFDDENRPYIIYTLDSIMQVFNCSKPKCVKIMKELDSEHGLGLIERKRRGQGKPDIIYVKKFSVGKETDEEKEPLNPNEQAEVKNPYFNRENNLTSKSKETEPLEVKEFNPNNIDENNTDNSNNLDSSLRKNTKCNDSIVINTEKYTKIYAEANRELIRIKIGYDYFMEHEDIYDKELIDLIVDIIWDVEGVPRKTIRIFQEEVPYDIVKSRFLTVNNSHVMYVMNRINKSINEIVNKRAYIRTMLYDAILNENNDYMRKTERDMCVENSAEDYNISQTSGNSP